MDKDKAIRSAKLTAAGILDKARARTAVTRAGGQIAPSKYLPNVPRQVHADGGKVAFQEGNHPDVPEVLYHGNAPKIVEDHKYHGDGKWTSDIDQEATNKNIAAQDFHTFRPSDYGNFGKGIYLSDSPNVASNFAQGIRGEQTEAKPHGQVMKLHVSMKKPFIDSVLRSPAWKDYIKDEIKKSFWGQTNRTESTAADDLIAKLDNDTATVRDLFLRESPDGLGRINQFGQDKIHETIRRSGFDGIIAHRPDGSKEYVAFKPEQIKSAIGNQGTFDPNDPDITKADGGSVTDSDEFRNWFGNSVTHTDGDPHVFYTGTSKDKDFTSFNVGRHGAWFTRDPAEASEYAERNDSQGYKHEAGWKLTPTNTASRVIPAYVKAENPYTGDLPDEVLRSNYKAAQSDWFDTLRRKGHDAWVPARYNGDLVVALKEPQQIKSIFNNGKFDPNQKHMNKAEGGTVDDTETQAPAARLGDGPQAGGFPIAGGIRGSESVLPAPLSPHGEVDLQGLPKDILIPKLGMKVTAGHNPAIRQVARDYTKQAGIDYSPPTLYKKVDPNLGKRISDAYADMAHFPQHPLVNAAYEAMKRETLDQYRTIQKAGVKMEFYPDVKKDPYHSQPRLMTEDVNNNNHMYVYPTVVGGFGTGKQPKGHENNPLLGDSGERWNGQPVVFNDLFRAVHDYFGHVKEGLGFRGDGEENAWRSHAAMYSPLARIALGAETRGQNSLLNYGPNGEHNQTASPEDTIYSPQKLGVMPVWALHEGAEFIKPEERAQMEAIYRHFGLGPEGFVEPKVRRAPSAFVGQQKMAPTAGMPPLGRFTSKPTLSTGGTVDDNPAPDIKNPMSIFPKPQRMFPEDQRPKGGQYISAHNKADVTGHKAEAATIGIGPNGKPFFQASQNAVDQTGTVGKGSATTKTNLFKQKAGWKWQDAPEGHENTETIVSVEHRGKHFYALNAHFPKGVDLARYENATSEPRLRPTTQGNVTLGPQAGSISVRGKMHPVYHHVIVKADGGSVGDALALTRRFTKDGTGATMALKHKGK
jgi:hypothetical protein